MFLLPRWKIYASASKIPNFVLPNCPIFYALKKNKSRKKRQFPYTSKSQKKKKGFEFPIVDCQLSNATFSWNSETAIRIPRHSRKGHSWGKWARIERESGLTKLTASTSTSKCRRAQNEPLYLRALWMEPKRPIDWSRAGVPNHGSAIQSSSWKSFPWWQGSSHRLVSHLQKYPKRKKNVWRNSFCYVQYIMQVKYSASFWFIIWRPYSIIMENPVWSKIDY